MFAHNFLAFNNRLIREAVNGVEESSLLTMFLIGLYALILITLSFYGGHRYMVIGRFLKGRKNQPLPVGKFTEETLPGITVQLPIYNEKYVINRLLDHVARLDYPRDRLEIQVLDDSTDETTAIAEAACARWRAEGLDVSWIHRTDRTGFKAGALAKGMEKAKYDLMAIFDADFCPEPNFLRQLVDHFTDENVGVAQARWGHMNLEHGALTRVQGLMLDGHFLLEHPSRNRTGLFFNFNGTGGIWRRQAIIDGGGWSHDTLTEDLDLSYRAQMHGWRFVYDPDVVCPAELPVEMNAFKSQQHRWAKGSIQVMRKLLPDVMRAKIPLRQKMEAFFHLTGNLCYPLMVVMCLLALPMLMLRARIADGMVGAVLDTGIFLCATMSVIVFYSFAQMTQYKDWPRRLLSLPMMLSIAIGMGINQAKAVIEALVGHQSEFVRTPKFGEEAQGGESWLKTSYRGVRNLIPWIELSFAVYYSVVVGYAIKEGLWLTLPFLMLFFTGFWYVGLLSLLQGRMRRVKVKSPAPATA